MSRICRLYLSVRLIFGVAIFISYGIQFYVPIEILYPPIKKRITTPLLKKYGELILRTVMVMLTCKLFLNSIKLHLHVVVCMGFHFSGVFILKVKIIKIIIVFSVFFFVNVFLTRS